MLDSRREQAHCIEDLTNKTRREEACLRRLDRSSGSWQVSTGGAGGVRWGRDGRELFMVTGETLMRAPIDARGDDLSVGQPEALFEVPPSPTEISFRDYDYDPVSDRFLFTRPPQRSSRTGRAAVDGARPSAARSRCRWTGRSGWGKSCDKMRRPRARSGRGVRVATRGGVAAAVLSDLSGRFSLPECAISLYPAVC